jgi:hypothetical protein
VVEINGIAVPPTISDPELVEHLMSLPRPVVLGFTRQGSTDFITANAEVVVDDVTSQMEVFSIKFTDFDKNLSDLVPGIGLGQYVEVLNGMTCITMIHLAHLQRSDLVNLDVSISHEDKGKLLRLGLAAFLYKEGLGDCFHYLETTVGVANVEDLIYLRVSDVQLMNLSHQQKNILSALLSPR